VFDRDRWAGEFLDDEKSSARADPESMWDRLDKEWQGMIQ
jgi:hypothetical protein